MLETGVSSGKGFLTATGKSSRQSGFTLIELLIVIAIIAILAAIAIPMFMKYKEGAYLDSARSDVKNAVTAMEAFNAQYSDYPQPTSCGPGPTQCSLADANSNTSTDALNVSPGDTVTIAADSTCANGYKISAYNSNIGSGPGSQSSPVSYDSCTGQYSGF